LPRRRSSATERDHARDRCGSASSRPRGAIPDFRTTGVDAREPLAVPGGKGGEARGRKGWIINQATVGKREAQRVEPFRIRQGDVYRQRSARGVIERQGRQHIRCRERMQQAIDGEGRKRRAGANQHEVLAAECTGRGSEDGRRIRSIEARIGTIDVPPGRRHARAEVRQPRRGRQESAPLVRNSGIATRGREDADPQRSRA
jgi:hypothetical protein